MFEKETRKWLDVDGDPGDKNSPNYPLVPFTSDAKGTVFDSRGVAYKQVEHGYTYPELQKWRYTKDGKFDEEAYKASIHATIERLYSTTPKAALLLKSNKKAAQVQMAAMTAENLQVENFPPALVALASKSAVNDANAPSKEVSEAGYGEPAAASWKSNDFVVNVVYDRYVNSLCQPPLN